MTTASASSGDHRPIRVGVIGANPERGWALSAHLPALAALDQYEVTAVATTRIESARATASAFGVPLAFDHVGDLVAHPDVDLVVVSVKVPEHDALIRAALDEHKHVLSEWPLGVDLDQARQLAERAGRSGVVPAIGLQGYFAPGAELVRRVIDRGDIGTPLAVSVVTAGGPGGNVILQEHRYTTDVGAGATVLTISVGHVLATLARAVGPWRSLNAIVAAVNQEATVQETGERVVVTAPDQVAVQGRLDNGAVASIAVQGGSPPSGPGFEVRIVGTDATVTVTPAAPGSLHIADWALTISRRDGAPQGFPIPPEFGALPVSVPRGPARNVARLYVALADSIRSGTPFPTDFGAAVAAHEILAAIQRASDTGASQAELPWLPRRVVPRPGSIRPRPFMSPGSGSPSPPPSDPDRRDGDDPAIGCGPHPEGHPLDHYLAVAVAYDRAAASGRPIKAVADAFAVSVPVAAAFVYDARNVHGLLTPSLGAGLSDGQLTEKALRIIDGGPQRGAPRPPKRSAKRQP